MGVCACEWGSDGGAVNDKASEASKDCVAATEDKWAIGRVVWLAGDAGRPLWAVGDLICGIGTPGVATPASPS